MSEQAASLLRARSKATLTKHNVVTHSIGTGVQFSCRFLSRSVCMDPHTRKVVPEARLEVGSRRRIQWPASRAQYFMNDWRRPKRCRRVCGQVCYVESLLDRVVVVRRFGRRPVLTDASLRREVRASMFACLVGMNLAFSYDRKEAPLPVCLYQNRLPVPALGTMRTEIGPGWRIRYFATSPLKFLSSR
jgi:hypothetical protein